MLFDENEGAEIIGEKEIDWRLFGMPKLFYEWCKEAQVHTPIGYNVNYKDKTIILFTSSPGPLIGLRGERVDRYTKILHLQPGYSDFSFEFKEITGGWANYIQPGKRRKRKC